MTLRAGQWIYGKTVQRRSQITLHMTYPRPLKHHSAIDLGLYATILIHILSSYISRLSRLHLSIERLSYLRYYSDNSQSKSILSYLHQELSNLYLTNRISTF